jgi:hypothetical protein
VNIAELGRAIAATERRQGVYNVKAYGAKGDGVADDTVAIKTAVTAAQAAGGRVYLPPGTYNISSAISLSDNASLQGGGAGVSVIRVTSAGVNAVVADGKTLVTLRDFSVVTTVAPSVAGYGVQIVGASTDILIERVKVVGFLSGFNIAGGQGAVAGTVKRITCRECTGNSNQNFGFTIDDCDTVTLDSCYGRYNNLDGAKLRKNTRNVQIRGGAYCENVTGNGLDAFAGGDTFTVTDTVFDQNGGAGLEIKTGDLTASDAATYGYVRNGLFSNIRVRNNAGHGLEFNRSSGDGTSQPLAAHFTVLGGIFEGNLVGIYVRARNVKVIGAIVRKNQSIGIDVRATASDVDLLGCMVIANSQSAAGGNPGVQIAGKRVGVIGGSINGAEGDAIYQDSDYASLTKYHNYGVLVADGSDDIFVREVQITNYTAGQSIRVNMTSGTRCVVEQRGPGLPEGNIFGGPGSTFIRTDAPDPTTAVWMKASGFSTSGWVKLHKLATAQTDSVAADITALRADFNALLAKLRAAGQMAP